MKKNYTMNNSVMPWVCSHVYRTVVVEFSITIAWNDHTKAEKHVGVLSMCLYYMSGEWLSVCLLSWTVSTWNTQTNTLISSHMSENIQLVGTITTRSKLHKAQIKHSCVQLHNPLGMNTTAICNNRERQRFTTQSQIHTKCVIKEHKTL